ncbi:MAG TPA: glutathionylspermidine synthase family protein [Cyclobacteriaceae bacterium]|jgi:glutathionylspermidine synthase|nr:glutathionylspermidine synthase family protein [Cyclobacteriaceae bacterium]
MKRHSIPSRHNWRTRVEQIGFSYHTLDGVTYWDETVYYEFSRPQTDVVETSTRELYQLCLQAVDHVVRHGLYDLFLIPDRFKNKIEDSWQRQDPSIYGRFDLVWNGDNNSLPKMLEFNADTPTSLFEGAAVQWFWLNDFNPKLDQFNSIHEKLVAQWRELRPKLDQKPLYFSCLHQFAEDVVNVNYLRDCAAQAGIDTRFISMRDIGRTKDSFVDLEEKKIDWIFKLYPWEWMMNEEFSDVLLLAGANWIEPAWKMLLSNKAILPVLWKLFPGHPNLLESYFDGPHAMRSFAQKPLLSREGSNIVLVEEGKTISETSGEYGEEGFIYQQLHKLPNFEGNRPVIGSWMIGDEAAGMGIRESSSLVTDNFSRFVPHVIA